MAGTSIADLLFLAAFSVLINKFDEECPKAKLSTTLDASAAAEFYGVASCLAHVTSKSIVYMDDLSRPIFCQPGQIISSVRKFTCIFTDFFISMGLYQISRKAKLRPSFSLMALDPRRSDAKPKSILIQQFQ